MTTGLYFLHFSLLSPHAPFLHCYVLLCSRFQEDNARERGLMDMMNGVLEIKKEDILKMVSPVFIDS